MTPAPLKVLLALFPACMLLLGSGITFLRGKTLAKGMQLVGATAVMLVVFTHFCEALHLFPAMHWGAEYSPGHYLDLVGAVVALTLFPTGYLLQALRERQ